MNKLPFPNYILGVDPGFTGALAVIEIQPSGHARLIEVIDMPLLKPSVFETKPRPHIDCPALAVFVAKYKPQLSVAVVERVSAAPDQGVVSMFRFGEGFGIIQGVLAAHGVRVLMPVPSVWKPSMGLNRNKSVSLNAARLVAGTEPFLKRMKDHGRAEAILLAQFGARGLISHAGGDVNDLF